MPYWKAAVGLSLLAASVTAMSLVPPWLQVPLLDRVLAPTAPAPPQADRMHVLGLVVLALAACQILGAAMGAAQGWLSAWLGNRITHSIRCELYEHLQYLSLSFFDKRQLGTVISRVNQDTGQLQGFLVSGSQDLITNFMQLFGIGVVIFFMNWKLALLVLIPAPAVAVGSRMVWKKIRYYMHRFFNRWGRLNAVLNETLTGLRVVKVFAQEPREIARFRKHSLDLADVGVQTERTWSLLFSGIGVSIGLGILFVQWLGGKQVVLGSMTVGHLSAFMTYVMMFYGPVRWMSMLLNFASRSMTAAERVFEVLDTRPEIIEDPDAVSMPHIEGHVEFRDVTFGYEKHHPALKHISFEARPDEMIGLVGHSGAGKTTTINLLCRFYDVDEGEILVDGVPIRKIRVEDLRHQIGVVPQDTFLFSGTITDNISYAKPGATREEIVRAAKIANAHDFILRKPDGYETYLGEGGGGLSAGERQRLAIARAILHNPRILILDEATSQVDVETESQIQQAIERLVAGRTTFAIAHRLSTLKNADRLLVLKDGEVVESGTHDELLKMEDGEFHRLVKTYQEISKVREVAR
jgi:ATP-binding cassette subfamily B protein